MGIQKPGSHGIIFVIDRILFSAVSRWTVSAGIDWCMHCGRW